MQMSLLVAHTVAREVEEQQVVAMFEIEELGDGLADSREPFVQKLRDVIEGADARRRQDFGQPADIDIRRGEPGQAGVLILTVADDERELARHRSKSHATRRTVGGGRRSLDFRSTVGQSGLPPGERGVIFWMSWSR